MSFNIPLIRNILYFLQDIIFPQTCIVCGTFGASLCSSCLNTCPQTLFRDKNIYAVFSYDHPHIRTALHELKYKNNTALAHVFAHSLHDKILEILSEEAIMNGFTKPLLIPIPLHKKRKRQRGYNQSELLCKELSLIDSVSFTPEYSVLYKCTQTKSQAEIQNRKERLRNLRDSFSVQNTDTLKNRNVILIDDIVTTGATLREAEKTLKKAGAKKVLCFAVAH